MKMKIQKVEAAEAQKRFDAIPDRKVGQWTEICKGVTEKGESVEVSGITRGQVWALKRKAKELGLRVKSSEKGTKVIILPAKSAK